MWYALFFAALLSADSLGVGISLGMSNVKTPLCAKIVATVVSVGFAAVSCFVGMAGGMVLNPVLCKTAGGFLLILSGVALLWNAEHDNKKDSDRDGSGEISVKEAVIMGFAVSADMLGAGTGFACGERIVWAFPLFAGTFQYIFLTLGDYAGRKINVPLWLKEKVIPYLPPIIITVLGVLKIITGLCQ